jgi:TupA-like ATPgrasp
LAVLFVYDDITGDVPRPRHLQQMIAAAETLACDLDFSRADFYDTPDSLYFGELTTTPEWPLAAFDQENSTTI